MHSTHTCPYGNIYHITARNKMLPSKLKKEGLCFYGVLIFLWHFIFLSSRFLPHSAIFSFSGNSILLLDDRIFGIFLFLLSQVGGLHSLVLVSSFTSLVCFLFGSLSLFHCRSLSLCLPFIFAECFV